MRVSTHALAGVLAALGVASSDVRAGGSVGAPRVGAEADEADGSDVLREVLAGAVTRLVNETDASGGGGLHL